MDYLGKADYIRHADWRSFVEARDQGTVPGRLVLLTTKGAEPYCDFEFRPDDILMLGSESKGVPDQVHNYVDARVVIPMQPEMRSLNVAMATAMTLGEALRQTNSFPKRT
jgi:tRNA (cytidine/uridine-2'-O-)-methyltransferase